MAKGGKGGSSGGKSTPQRANYHVTKRDDHQWQGKREDATRASVVGDTKDAVKQRTIEIAKNVGHSSVRTHGADGKIQEERTYGDDPFPPKG